jgi:hypothetical protein
VETPVMVRLHSAASKTPVNRGFSLFGRLRRKSPDPFVRQSVRQSDATQGANQLRNRSRSLGDAVPLPRANRLAPMGQDLSTWQEVALVASPALAALAAAASWASVFQARRLAQEGTLPALQVQLTVSPDSAVGAVVTTPRQPQTRDPRPGLAQIARTVRRELAPRLRRRAGRLAVHIGQFMKLARVSQTAKLGEKRL